MSGVHGALCDVCGHFTTDLPTRRLSYHPAVSPAERDAKVAKLEADQALRPTKWREKALEFWRDVVPWERHMIRRRCPVCRAVTAHALVFNHGVLDEPDGPVPAATPRVSWPRKDGESSVSPLDVLAEYGVHVVELEWLERDAVFVASADALLVRRGLDTAELAETVAWLLRDVLGRDVSEP